MGAGGSTGAGPRPVGTNVHSRDELSSSQSHPPASGFRAAVDLARSARSPRRPRIDLDARGGGVREREAAGHRARTRESRCARRPARSTFRSEPVRNRCASVMPVPARRAMRPVGQRVDPCSGEAEHRLRQLGNRRHRPARQQSQHVARRADRRRRAAAPRRGCPRWPSGEPDRSAGADCCATRLLTPTTRASDRARRLLRMHPSNLGGCRSGPIRPAYIGGPKGPHYERSARSRAARRSSKTVGGGSAATRRPCRRRSSPRPDPGQGRRRCTGRRSPTQ